MTGIGWRVILLRIVAFRRIYSNIQSSHPSKPSCIHQPMKASKASLK
uniref:Uncharacterized protein n=1 Tax=Rhizophora mucronata TaxID=61149 RepID=A0A2P2IIF3_RHIMU